MPEEIIPLVHEMLNETKALRAEVAALREAVDKSSREIKENSAEIRDNRHMFLRLVGVVFVSLLIIVGSTFLLNRNNTNNLGDKIDSRLDRAGVARNKQLCELIYSTARPETIRLAPIQKFIRQANCVELIGTYENYRKATATPAPMGRSSG